MTVITTPTSELVAVAWIRSLGLPVDGVGTSLPAESEWLRRGFVTVFVVSGPASIYTPVSTPRVQLDCWAADKDHKHPPWGRANVLAQLIFNATQHLDTSRAVTLPSGYDKANVKSVWPLTEPQRLQSDPAYVARYKIDVALMWASHTR